VRRLKHRLKSLRNDAEVRSKPADDDPRRLIDTVPTDLARIAEETRAYKSSGQLLVYGQEFAPFRDAAFTILEIGVKDGGSVALWSRYFSRAKIVGVDIRPRETHEVDRITMLQGDQSDTAFIERLADEHGPFGIIIDDGSHVPAHQIATFEALFPHLMAGGLYICEDIHTSLTKFTDEPSALDYFQTFVGRLMVGAEKSGHPAPDVARHVYRVMFYWRSVLLQKLPLGPKYRVPPHA